VGAHSHRSANDVLPVSTCLPLIPGMPHRMKGVRLNLPFVLDTGARLHIQEPDQQNY